MRIRGNNKKKAGKDLYLTNDPKSSFSESIRTVRTNLGFSSVNKEIKTILVTSPEPGDGKSFISANLAAAYAMDNKKVLIVDCDLRRGRQCKIFGIKKFSDKGYTNLILNYRKNTDLSKYIVSTSIDNLYLLPNGPTPPNPIELLSSNNNKKLLDNLRGLYDIIILDCPPALGLSDTLIMTRYSDANIVNITYKKTKIEALKEVKKNMEKANSSITGVIINKCNKKKSSYYYGYY